MKKLLIFAISLFILADYQNVSADVHGIYLKGGYLKPYGNIRDYDATYTAGIATNVTLFDFLLGINMIGVDYFFIEKKESLYYDDNMGVTHRKNVKSEISVTSLHYDLFLSPFFGLAPACNLFGKDESGVKMGIDLLFLAGFPIPENILIALECRYKFLDVFEKRSALSLTLGFWYTFE